jgi:homoserine O-acetyltransferase
MNRRPVLVLALTTLLAPTLAMSASAAAPQVITQAANSQSKPKDALVDIHDFVFGDGERLPSLKLHYLTLGTPRRDASGAIINTVLMLPGTGSSSADFVRPAFFDALYGAGEPLDLDRYFLVMPDVIGMGNSSKPSDGLQSHFPHYGYIDLVRAEHLMLSRIGIKHLKLVLGTSKGGMQAWLWGEMFPNDMDALVAISSTPAEISGRNMIWREMIIQDIRSDPAWKNGDYPKDSPPKEWLEPVLSLSAIMEGTADQLQKRAPTRKTAMDLVDKMGVSGGETYDADDILYDFESSADYDPAQNLSAIIKPMLTINFEDDLINPPELLHLPTAPNFTKVMFPAGPDSYGHMTLAHPAVWASALQSFLQGLPHISSGVHLTSDHLAKSL